MKKIYYLLCMLPLMPVVSSCSDDAEVVLLQNTNQELTIETVSPEQGYVGEQFTLTGSGFGGSKELLKVFIGDFEGELVSCSNARIVVKVPEEAVSGKVILELIGRKTDTGFTYTVLGSPVLSVSATKGFKEREISFTGTGMPATEDNFTVTMGGVEAAITAYSADDEGNATMTVMVPRRLETGRNKVVVKLLDTEVYTGNFEVLVTPEVDLYSGRLLRKGSDVTFTGSGFRNFRDNVTVDFNGEVVTPSSVTDETITVSLPASFEGGDVKINFEGYATIDAGNISILTAGDVTDMVLKNSVQPFASSDGAVNRLADWMTDGFSGDALRFDEDPDGLLTLASKNDSGKMYQTIMLPQGSYKIELDVVKCETVGGRFGAIFAVSKGSGTLPDLEGSSDWYPKATDANYANLVKWVSLKAADVPSILTVDFELEEDTEVTLGFVVMIYNPGSVIQLSSVKVSLEE